MEVHKRWRCAANDYALLIENKGSGMSLIQDLENGDIHAIAARIEARSVWPPRRAPWLEDFRQEVMAFPIGRYSDEVDARSQGLHRAFD